MRFCGETNDKAFIRKWFLFRHIYFTSFHLRGTSDIHGYFVDVIITQKWSILGLIKSVNNTCFVSIFLPRSIDKFLIFISIRYSKKVNITNFWIIYKIYEKYLILSRCTMACERRNILITLCRWNAKQVHWVKYCLIEHIFNIKSWCDFNVHILNKTRI